MTIPDPGEFSQTWLNAFNAHDIDAVLAHFHDDVVFTSPVAARVAPETAGIVHGKATLRTYWIKTLTSVPDLHFELVEVYAGVDTIVITHRDQTGQVVAEVLTFDGDLVIKGHGTYPV